MQKSNLKISKEIGNIIKNRRKKLLLYMYIISFIVFSISLVKDFYYSDHFATITAIIAILFIIISYIIFYRKAKYNHASFMILFIFACITIGSIVFNKFDNYSIIFIIPFSISTFFLFSWQKGMLINVLFFLVLTLTVTISNSYFEKSIFLSNHIAVNNFIFTLVIIFVFTYVFELTRVEADKMLVESNNTKDLLYRELQHRVKNNLNIVLSMLGMQAQKENKQVQDIINISKKRIEAIAMVHSMLYVSDDIEKVKVKDFLEKLSNNLKSSYNKNITIQLKIKEQELPLNEIIPIGLIINELLTNSLKYAFDDIMQPKVTIVFKIFNKKAILTYHDNGPGYKKDKIDTMGLKLVTLNVKQLKGTLKVNEVNGLGYKIVYERDSNV